MAINDILNKIKDEANKKAAFEKQVTNDEIKKIKAEAEDNAKAKMHEIDNKVKDKCVSMAEQAKILANMESRSVLLKEKRMVISEAYKASLDELNALDDKAYTDLLISMFKSASKSMPEGELVVPANKKHQTESAMRNAGANFEIAKETNDFKGGFIVRSKKVEINLSFPYLMSNIVRPHTELEVAEILF
jgi:vacuolar-type H+-ATPase subunit E/Vma4